MTQKNYTHNVISNRHKALAPSQRGNFNLKSSCWLETNLAIKAFGVYFYCTLGVH
jgi:hypothetical protein